MDKTYDFFIWIEMKKSNLQSKSKIRFWICIVNHNPIHQIGLQFSNPIQQYPGCTLPKLWFLITQIPQTLAKPGVWQFTIILFEMCSPVWPNKSWSNLSLNDILDEGFDYRNFTTGCYSAEAVVLGSISSTFYIQLLRL